MSTITTRSGKGSPLTNSEVDSNFTNLNTDKAELSGATFTGEIVANGGIALGDNDKATFGADDDLQIYHDGTNSYIDNAGSGSLIIQDTDGTGDIFIRPKSGQTAIAAYNDNTVQLAHSGDVKLSTTSTGIDVTGTATMDGLVVNGAASIFGIANANLQLASTGGNAYQLRTDVNSAYIYQANRAAPIAQFGYGGDISFYEDTGTTAKFFWDASAESLGIGTSSPANEIHIKTSVPFVKLESTDTGYNGFNAKNDSGNFYFGIDGSGGNFYGSAYARAIYSDGAYPVTFYTNAAERMRIDASGVTTFKYNTKVYTAGYPETRLGISDSNYFNFTFDNPSDALNIGKNGSTKMTLSASGDLLVGNTDPSTGGTVAGHRLISSGFAYHTRDDGLAAAFNRLTENGAIAEFRKDGVTVGSIGTLNRLTIGNAATGLSFNSSTVAVQPHNMTTNAATDNTIDLGVSGARFKDLYLSGNINTSTVTVTDGVYIGGNGFANKLDDYEEGTWTPTGSGVTLGSPVGTYTKVGRLVTVNWLFVYPSTASGDASDITGLPFSVGTGYTNGGNQGYVSGSTAASIAHITAVTTSLLYRTANGGVTLTHADLSGATIRGSMTYMTA